MSSGRAPKKVDVRDRYRVLLTEVLPYEVPLWFTNDYLRDECCAGHHLKPREPLGFMLNALRKAGSLVPYSYWVIRDEGGVRELSIMHPTVQLDTVHFYAKYDEVILHFCAKSMHSLRAPRKIVTRFYEIPSGDATTHGVEEEEREKSYCSSYFQYSRYAFLYRFFESYDYHSLEKRYRHMRQVDIAKCFDSIYTHTISWAVKSKVFAKKNRGTASFDCAFDKLMMQANYGETNGIIVGPELSRIFAEIILQEVDARLVRALKDRGLKVRKDYDYRRFVDDYFIFSSNETAGEEVVRELSRVLAGFKMHLNDLKSNYHLRPFLSPLSLCKLDLSREIDRIFDSRWTCQVPRRLAAIPAPSTLANRTIVDIKSVVKRFSVSYKSVCSYFLSGYSGKVQHILGSFDRERDGEDTIASMLLVDLDTVFFFYSMDIRVRPTDWVARFVQKVLEFVEELSAENQYLIRKKVFDMARHAIDVSLGVSESVSFVEIQNMLLVLSPLGSEFILEESYLQSLLEKFLEREAPGHECTYFMWVTLMLYIRDSKNHAVLRRTLIDRMLLRFEEDDYCLDSSELFMHLMDCLTCPWVEDVDKLKLLSLASRRHAKLPTTQPEQRKLLKRFEGRRFFVDWHDREWAAKRLEKKKYAYPYE